MRAVFNEDEEFATYHETLIEKAKLIGYPIQGDSRGYARINFRNKVENFGTFDSPKSYILFGLWKAQVVQGHINCQCKDLRPIATAALEQRPYTPPKAIHKAWFIAVVLLGLALNAGAIFAGFNVYSSYKPTAVDGIDLSVKEVSLIRLVRKNPHFQGEPADEHLFNKRMDLLESMEAHKDAVLPTPLHSFGTKHTPKTP